MAQAKWALGVGPLTQRPRITEKQIPTSLHTYVLLHKNKLDQEGRRNKQQLWGGNLPRKRLKVMSEEVITAT